MTRRLYYDNARLRGFDAQIVEAAPGRVYLSETAFYPTSGGQPHDLGSLNGIRVLDVIDEDDRIAHMIEGNLAPGPVHGEIDWPRRFDHMQQHTGQHLLSATIAEMFQIPTLSFHLGAETSTIDIQTPSLTTQQTAAVERRANDVVFENRPVSISYRDAAEDLGLRKASERTGTLRIVTIEDFDTSACGGTHLRSTAEIGPIVIGKLDKMRGKVRVEFTCGLRAIAALRTANDSLTHQLAAQSARLSDTDKERRRIALALAEREGRELHALTQASPNGLRIHIAHPTGPMPEEARARATAFINQGNAVWIEFFTGSLLLAVSPGSNLHAGNLLKPLLARYDAKGGGSATMAQASLPPEAESELLAMLHSLCSTLPRSDS